MLLSCVSILAVDFPLFPRRFAKTETFGKSLMDVGVGAIVISMGLVHGKLLGKPLSFGSMIGKAVRGSVPLLLIGSLRFWTVKASDYQVVLDIQQIRCSILSDVSEQVPTAEYGLHWNFFWTLGLLPLCGAVIEYTFNGENLALIGTATALCTIS